MSLDALRDVMTRSHTAGAARLVLLVIAYHANPKTGDSYCSRRLLAQEANVSTATVHAALGELLAKGEIEILMCGTGRKSTTYRLTASDSAIEPLADGVAAQSATRSGSPDGPVVAQSAGPSIGGTEEQGKVEPRASTAPPDGGASRSNGQVPPDAAAAIAALKASSRRVPTSQCPDRQGLTRHR